MASLRALIKCLRLMTGLNIGNFPFSVPTSGLLPIPTKRYPSHGPVSSYPYTFPSSSDRAHIYSVFM